MPSFQIHPFLVHFPIALITVAALFDLIGVLWKRQFFTRSAFAMLLVASAVAVIVGISGYAAEARLEQNIQILAAVADNLTHHASLGNTSVWLIVAVGLFRIWSVLERKTWSTNGWIFPLVMILLSGWVIYTGLAGIDLSQAIRAAYQAMN
ncbi:MAG: hypothetical protein COY19_02165 [Candidatus Marinimicrobia bacterium CG_4_10_14_0_2_um_filter_48_9]|nr:MAG: hypothetical protein COY19_02165 [Candidatus Marinimicrobia bacterium CG_4_10_14_0_2_um_filter_48_9]